MGEQAGEYGSLEYRCDASRSALVLIDVQVDFCVPHGVVNPAALSMARCLASLLGAAHDAGVPVVFVRTEHGTDSDTPAWRSRRGRLVGYEAELCKPGTPGAEFYEVAPAAGDLVLTKHRYDAFVGTALDDELRRRGVEGLVFGGIMTDVCVETSARHATCLDYLVTVAADGCASGDADRHARGLAAIRGAFGLVADAQAIAACWSPPEPAGAASGGTGGAGWS